MIVFDPKDVEGRTPGVEPKPAPQADSVPAPTIVPPLREGDVIEIPKERYHIFLDTPDYSLGYVCVDRKWGKNGLWRAVVFYGDSMEEKNAKICVHNHSSADSACACAHRIDEWEPLLESSLRPHGKRLWEGRHEPA